MIRTAVGAAKIDVKNSGWYIPHYTPDLENQQIVLVQILNKDPTELQYKEWIVFRKEKSTNNYYCAFELENAGEVTPTFVMV